METKIEKQIESILFWKAEPVSFKELSKILSKDQNKISEDQIKNTCNALKLSLADRGINIIVGSNEACMVTSADCHELIDNLQKEELNKDLSKATLETFSIILYRGPMKRSDIDYIRGVNSQFILRNLLVRGLIDKKIDPKDERSYVYQVSTEALAYLGVNSVKDLPEYEKLNVDIDNFLNHSENENKKTENIKENEAISS